MYEFPHDLPNDFCLNILENFKEIPEMLGIDGKVLSRPAKSKVFTAVLQHCKQSAV